MTSLQEAKELHAPVIRKFRKRKIITRGIDDLWAGDLLVLKEYSRQNRGFKYILNIIDTFSKYMFLEPLKTKTGKEVATAFERIIKRSRRCPKLLHVDRGKEFYNSAFRSVLEKHSITMYHTNNDEKSAIAERANRTINSHLKIHFTKNGNHKWVDFLKKLTKTYNNDVHRTIGMAPSQVNKSNEKEIYERVFSINNFKFEKPKYRVGDLVRIATKQSTFENKYKAPWTREIFIIRRIHYTDPITYSIQDQSGEQIIGKFYNLELLKTKCLKELKTA